MFGHYFGFSAGESSLSTSIISDYWKINKRRGKIFLKKINTMVFIVSLLAVSHSKPRSWRLTTGGAVLFDNCRFLFWMVGIFLCMCGMHTSCGCVRARHTHVCVHVWHVHVVCVSSSHSPSVSVFRCVLLVHVCACLVVCVCVCVSHAHIVRVCLAVCCTRMRCVCLRSGACCACTHACVRLCLGSRAWVRACRCVRACAHRIWCPAQPWIRCPP